MIDNFESLNAFVESSLEALREEIDLRFEAILREHLAEWSKRWPRHQFSGWQGHGMLSIDVSPNVCGQKRVDKIPDFARRGAIAELYNEIDAFQAAHCELEWSLSTSEFLPISSQEKAP